MRGVLWNELRGELLKKPDLTLQTAHDYCRAFEAAELQKFKLITPTRTRTQPSNIHPVRKFKVQDKATPRFCTFCGYKHPFTQPSRCPSFGKKVTISREKDTFQRYAKKQVEKV